MRIDRLILARRYVTVIVSIETHTMVVRVVTISVITLKTLAIHATPFAHRVAKHTLILDRSVSLFTLRTEVVFTIIEVVVRTLSAVLNLLHAAVLQVVRHVECVTFDASLSIDTADTMRHLFST